MQKDYDLKNAGFIGCLSFYKDRIHYRGNVLMINDPAAAALGLLGVYVMDMYEGNPDHPLIPTIDPRLAKDWNVVGYLTATDAVLHKGQKKISLNAAKEAFYGVVAQSIASPTQYVAVVRGTSGIIEWIEDAEFVQIPHPVAGRVEEGFWGIYSSMRLRINATTDPQPVVEGICKLIGANASLTVVGHSLGSAISTYLTFDLATPLSNRLSACLFASPHPGDENFGKAFDARVSHYKVYNYTLDIVPRVPMGFDYHRLPGAIDLRQSEAQAKIRMTPACNHHLVCYCSMLDYDLEKWSSMPAQDQPCCQCIKGAM